MGPLGVCQALAHLRKAARVTSQPCDSPSEEGVQKLVLLVWDWEWEGCIFCPDPTLRSCTGLGSPGPAVDLLCLLDLTEEPQFQVNAGGTGHCEAPEEGFLGQGTPVPGGSKEPRLFACL